MHACYSETVDAMKINSARNTIPPEILADRKLARVFKKIGDIKRRPKTPVFQSLVRAIIYQQISGKAADSIMKKFVAHFRGTFPTPITLSKTRVAHLRTAGISNQKASYLKDLSNKFVEGTIDPLALKKMTNEEIITHLTQVKGIGVWTVHMFLIFTLRRPDVLPTGDLGIKKGFQKVYGIKKLPSTQIMERLARPWRMHASLASLYLWRANDLTESDW